MKTVRFGFVGAGKIAAYSAKALLAHPKAKLVAAQDFSAERLGAFAKEFGVRERYATSAELFASKKVDAVYIAVPNKFHAELAIAAMKAGKHVLLEKPFAMSAAEAEQVLKVAKRTKRAFMLGMNQRYRAESQKIKSLSAAGAFGEIYYAKAYWFRRSGIPTLGTWFGNKALAGAGCINDIGVHLLDLCLHVMGNFDPVAVSGATYSKFGARGLGEGNWGNSDKSETTFDVDDFASALIKLRNGATVSLEASWACHQEEANRMNVEIFGTEAGANLYPGKVFHNDPLNADYQIIENPNGAVPMPHCERFHNFVNHLLGQEELLVKPDEALAVQRILDAVAESCSTGREVRLD